jgi:hypothetical protein
MTTPILHENLPIIEVAEAYILDMLIEDKVAAPLLLTRLSDQVAVVAPAKLDALLARLLQLGHTPKVVR